MKKVTQKDIAEAAGVATMTVSLALRNHPSILQSTRERIQAIAQKLNYVPDPALAALNHYRVNVIAKKFTTTIAYLTNWPTDNSEPKWRKLPLYMDFIKGASERTSQLGYSVEEFRLNEPRMTCNRMSQILYHRNIHGAIVAPLPQASGSLDMDWSKLSSIAIGYSLHSPQLHRVANHHYRSTILLMNELQKCGYKRIGLALIGQADERVEHNFLAGYLVGQRSFPSEQQLPVCMSLNKERFARWYETHRPDVVMSSNSILISILQDMKLHVPGDVGFAHLDCPDKEGRIAGISQRWDLIGKTSIELLIGLMHRSEKGIPDAPITSLVPGLWVRGKTIRQMN